MKRIAGGNSLVLSDAEVRRGNSTVGLNLLVWHNTVHPQNMLTLEFGTAAMTSFEESYRGYRLREFIGQADCLEHLHAMCKRWRALLRQEKRQLWELSRGGHQQLLGRATQRGHNARARTYPRRFPDWFVLSLRTAAVWAEPGAAEAVACGSFWRNGCRTKSHAWNFAFRSIPQSRKRGA